MEAYNAKQNRTYRSYACPHGIGCADGQRLHRHGKQPHADNETSHKTSSPQAVCPAFLALHLARQKAKAVSNNPAIIKIIQSIRNKV